MVFRNPARGIKVGQHPYGIAQPLGQDDVDQAAEAAATPSARMVLVLAAVHAARTGAVRAAQLDDVDLGNRRLIIAGRVRPIDEFTHQILLDWLDYRRTRWPDTANPHLLINQQSAMGTGPVSTIYYAKTKLRGQAATLERLRVDRQLEEALAHRPDPLHLAAVFGLDPKTAIRYAENVRLLLETTAEQQAARAPSAENNPASSPAHLIACPAWTPAAEEIWSGQATTPSRTTTAATTIQRRSTARGWLTSRLIFPIAGTSSISDAAAAFRLPGASQPPVTG
jgi:hypothetical protein